MTFDKAYYDRIWGTVHRHDYCYALACQLRARFGRGARILDVGTGCGHLVSTLRALGCDAWGIDFSDYAVANSCAPGHVLNASVLDIPFRSGFFDAVHSQGVFEYIAEDKIDEALVECRRVGRVQLHTADHEGSEVDEEQFATRKPKEWWGQQLDSPDILIACPVHAKKGYSLQRWIDNAASFSYPHTSIIIADTTEDDSLRESFRGKANFIAVGGGWGWGGVAVAMNRIREYFLANKHFRYWFNVESDILPPRGCIEQMLRYGAGADWISHCFPRRLGGGFDQGIGCSMLSRRLMENFSWPDTRDTPDCALWEQVRPLNQYQVVEMWGFFQCQHLTE